MSVTLVLACGAIAHEIEAVRRLNGWGRSRDGSEDGAIRLQCLPADWHNQPANIAPGVRAALLRALAQHPEISQVLIGYGDCGSGGVLDRTIAVVQTAFPQVDIARLPGDHCYAFYMGVAAFDKTHTHELGTFYVTDFLLRHFERLIIHGLALDRHPQLLPLYFGHYTRLLWMHQTPADAARLQQAQTAAKRLGLRLDTCYTGYGELQSQLETRVHGLNRKVIAIQAQRCD